MDVPDIDTVRAWEGRTMVDRDGNPIGSINAIYLDDRTGQPAWALAPLRPRLRPHRSSCRRR
jgi:hypothetical protein